MKRCDGEKGLSYVEGAGGAMSRCQGYASHNAGSGGAEVIAYYTADFDPAAREFVLTWNCPSDSKALVKVGISLGNAYVPGSSGAAYVNCSQGKFTAPAEIGTRKLGTDNRIYALVELEYGPCERPRLLNATLKIPAALGKAGKGPLEDEFNHRRVLVTSSNQVGNWSIDVTSPQKVIRGSPRPNGGTLGNLLMEIPTSKECMFLPVHAERDVKAGGDTWIASIQQ